MMRALILIGLIAGMGAAQAVAQVASPSLLPGTVRMWDAEQFHSLAIPTLERFSESDLTFVPINPAAMQWSRTSEIGVGGMKSSGHYDDGALPGQIDFSGPFAGLRWVTPYVSLGAATLLWKGHSQATSGHDDRLSDAALAFQGFGVLALGARTYQMKQSFHFDVGAGTYDQYKVHTPSQGASLRLGGVFYLGYVASKEHHTFSNLTSPTNDFQLSRDVKAAGIAYSSDSKTPWRIEVYRRSKEGVVDASGNYLNEERETAVTLEAQFGQLILGAASHSGKATGVPPSALTQTITLRELTIAWVTAGKWSTTLHVEKMDTTAEETAVPYKFTRDATTSAVSLGRQF